MHDLINYMIEAQGIYIRLVEKADALRVYMWELDPETQLVTQTKNKVSLEMIYSMIEQQTDVRNSGQLRMMICLHSNKEAIGIVDLYDVDFANSKGTIGVLVYEKKLRRMGFAKKAILELQEYAQVVLSLRKIDCLIQESNKASISLFESLGYTRIIENPLKPDQLIYQVSI
ncbi:MAG: GNAT family N-acetyltransferase [Crocinitomicaceae bacterium]